MKITSNIKAGRGEEVATNHNQTIKRGLKLKSKVKAGGVFQNHSQTVRSKVRIPSVDTNER